MGLILKENAHRKLLALHRALEKEIRCRSRLCLGRTLAVLDAMHELMVARGSWRERERRKD